MSVTKSGRKCWNQESHGFMMLYVGLSLSIEKCSKSCGMYLGSMCFTVGVTILDQTHQDLMYHQCWAWVRESKAPEDLDGEPKRKADWSNSSNK